MRKQFKPSPTQTQLRSSFRFLLADWQRRMVTDIPRVTPTGHVPCSNGAPKLRGGGAKQIPRRFLTLQTLSYHYCSRQIHNFSISAAIAWQQHEHFSRRITKLQAAPPRVPCLGMLLGHSIQCITSSGATVRDWAHQA